ncbi:MAG: DUF493 family protein [Bdellovibrionota bacterium]
MNNTEEARLIALLDAAHTWPSIYAFKFIVPAAKAKELEALIIEAISVETRPSAEGKYLAYTFQCPMASAREVLEIYARVKVISGVVAL